MARQLWPYHPILPVQNGQGEAPSSSHPHSTSSAIEPASLLPSWNLLPDVNYLFHGSSLFSHCAPSPPPPPPPSLLPDMDFSLDMQQIFQESIISMEGAPQKKAETLAPSPATPNSSLSSSSNDAHQQEEVPPAPIHGVNAAADRDEEVEEEEEEEEEGANITDERKLKQQTKPRKKGQKRIRQPRIAFVTKSDVDHLEDGYRWRKYGQKAVKNSPYPRSYFRCTNTKCSVKKRVERSSEDPSFVVTTYEGQHTHHIPISLRGSIEPRIQDTGLASFNPSPFSFLLPTQPSPYLPPTASIDPRILQLQKSLHTMQARPARAMTSPDESHIRDQAAAMATMARQPQSAAFLLHESLLQDMLPYDIHNMI